MNWKKRYLRFFLLLILGAILLLSGCQRPKGGLTVAGSTSVQPFAEILAEEYMANPSQEKIFIQGGGIERRRSGRPHRGGANRDVLPEFIQSGAGPPFFPDCL